MKSRGLVFDIQRYAIHDGPGIRTIVFLKGCPLRCLWCQNPESQRKQPEVFLRKDRCTLCGQCVAICPTGASKLAEESSIIDRHKCIGCGECVKVCPNEARKLVGRDMTVDEVIQEVIKDRRFYENSGGGVTLSGGEPTFQPEFAQAILQSCKQQGINTVVETCGYCSWPTLSMVLKYADLVLYDIKLIDRTKHREATGVPNDLILENAKRVAAYRPMKVRMPLIPGFTDSPENVRAVARFARVELGLDSRDIDLLPYNKLGEAKYEALGRPLPLHANKQSDRYVEELKAIVADEAV